jgi:hypothetical protein
VYVLSGGGGLKAVLKILIWDGRNFGYPGWETIRIHVDTSLRIRDISRIRNFSILDPHQIIFPKSDPRCLFRIMNFDLDLEVKGIGPRMGIRNTFRNLLDLFPKLFLG